VSGVPVSFTPDFNVIDREIEFITAATPHDQRNLAKRDPQLGIRICATTSISQDRGVIGFDDVSLLDFDRSSRDAQDRTWSETQELAFAR
jgi:hypothetical protein